MAIKIIKPGNPVKAKQTRRFTCLFCGCIFSADLGDYEAVMTHSQPDDEITHQAICPICHKLVRRSEPLDE